MTNAVGPPGSSSFSSAVIFISPVVCTKTQKNSECKGRQVVEVGFFHHPVNSEKCDILWISLVGDVCVQASAKQKFILYFILCFEV